MADFEGFFEQTNDILTGIRFNNNKAWFDEKRNAYKKYVHNPMVLFANECYEFIHDMDSNFVEIPKISRVNRDIRFSKDKSPYKECKWFFLRESGKPDIVYNRPTYFFEMSPDWYRYGFFYSPVPKKMEIFRKAVDANKAELLDMIEIYSSQREFVLTGEEYKRAKTENEEIKDFYNKKWLQFTHYENYTNPHFYSAELLKDVCGGFKRLYPLYRYFEKISNIEEL